MDGTWLTWPRGLALVLAVAGGVALPMFALSQEVNPWRGYWRRSRMPPRFVEPDRATRAFSFCRVLYESVRDEDGGNGWDTDYPDADNNFMIRLSELTTTSIAEDPHGEPDHVVVRLTEDPLSEFPFLFMSDVGTVGFTDEEAARLREYLLRGGFLWVDDFWGPRAWQHWTEELGKVLSPAEYPIKDLQLDHPIFRGMFQVGQVPQIPSIQFWRRHGGMTSERGADSATPYFRGISDADGRLMVFMSYNTDIADGWEREGQDQDFFHAFSIDAYAVGVNVLLYAMTH